MVRCQEDNLGYISKNRYLCETWRDELYLVSFIILAALLRKACPIGTGLREAISVFLKPAVT